MSSIHNHDSEFHQKMIKKLSETWRQQKQGSGRVQRKQDSCQEQGRNGTRQATQYLGNKPVSVATSKSSHGLCLDISPVEKLAMKAPLKDAELVNNSY